MEILGVHSPFLRDQLLKCLLCKHKDMSSDPQRSDKVVCGSVCICNPPLLWGYRRVETGGSLEAHGRASLAYEMANKKAKGESIEAVL